MHKDLNTTIYRVVISARKEGAIGTHGTEHRVYAIETANPNNVNFLAINRAYKEGGLEHIKVLSVEPIIDSIE